MGKSIADFFSVTRVGLDLAKNVFQVHAVNAHGEVIVARKVRRGALLDFFARLPPWNYGELRGHDTNSPNRKA